MDERLPTDASDKAGTIVLSDSGELDSVISLDINAYIEEIGRAHV